MKSWLTIVIAAGIFLAGCEPVKKPYNAVDITGAVGYGNDFRLTDHTGKPRTIADFRGQA